MNLPEFICVTTDTTATTIMPVTKGRGGYLGDLGVQNEEQFCLVEVQVVGSIPIFPM